MRPRPRIHGRFIRRQPEQTARRRDGAVAQLAARQWGVVSVHELRAAGLSDDEIATRVRREWLHPLHRGVFAVGHPNPPLEGRFLAAVKACGPGAALSHFAAGALWGFVEWDGRTPEVTVPRSRTPPYPHIRAHRSRLLELGTDVTWHRRIPVTTPARTLLDLASQLGERELRHAVRRAQSLQRVSLRGIADALTRLRGRRGARRLARIIASGPAPTRSVLEDVVLDLILSGGFAKPDVNVPLVLDGRRVVPDFRWASIQLVLEADSRAWHDHKIAREDDAERQALLEAHGERVLRVTWEQAIGRPAETLARLRAAGAPLIDGRFVRAGGG